MKRCDTCSRPQPAVRRTRATGEEEDKVKIYVEISSDKLDVSLAPLIEELVRDAILDRYRVVSGDLEVHAYIPRGEFETETE